MAGSGSTAQRPPPAEDGAVQDRGGGRWQAGRRRCRPGNGRPAAESVPLPAATRSTPSAATAPPPLRRARRRRSPLCQPARRRYCPTGLHRTHNIALHRHRVSQPVRPSVNPARHSARQLVVRPSARPAQRSVRATQRVDSVRPAGRTSCAIYGP